MVVVGYHAERFRCRIDCKGNTQWKSVECISCFSDEVEETVMEFSTFDSESEEMYFDDGSRVTSELLFKMDEDIERDSLGLESWEDPAPWLARLEAGEDPEKSSPI